MSSEGEGGSPRRTLPEREPSTVVIRHEEQARVRKGWRGVGRLRAKRSVEVVPVHERFSLDEETLGERRVPLNENDSGRIEVLDDGSVSIPIYAEELVVTRRTVLKERVIIKKELTSRIEQVTAELRQEHVAIDTEGDVDVTGDLEEP